MPRIPFPDDNQLRPEPFGQGLASVPNYAPEAFGVGLANAGVQFGEALDKRLEKDALLADHEQTARAKIAYQTAADNEAEVIARTKGVDAAEGSQLAYDNLAKAKERILAKDLNNDRQRKLFNLEALEVDRYNRKIIERHVGEQLDLADKGLFPAALQKSKTAIVRDVRSSDDAPLIEDQYRIADRELQRQLVGQHPAVVAEASAGLRGELYGLAVSSILDSKRPGSAKEAKMLLDTNKEAFGLHFDEAQKKVTLALKYELPNDVVAKSLVLFPDGRVDQGKSLAALKTNMASLDAEGQHMAGSLYETQVKLGHGAAESDTGYILDQAKVAWERGDPAKGIPAYGDPRLSVPIEIQNRLMDPNRKGGADGWHTLMGWWQQMENSSRVNANLASPAQLRQQMLIGQNMVVDHEMYQKMPAEAFYYALMAPDPATGLPKVTYPQFRELASAFIEIKKGGEKKPPQLVDDGKLLVEELDVAGFAARPSGPGKAKAIPPPEHWTQLSTEAAAWKYFGDALATWRRNNVDADQATVRKWIKEKIGEEKLKKIEATGFLSTFKSNPYQFEVTVREDLKHYRGTPPIGTPVMLTPPPAPVAPAAPVVVPQPIDNSQLPQVSTQKAYDELPPGTIYFHVGDQKRKVKRGSP